MHSGNSKWYSSQLINVHSLGRALSWGTDETTQLGLHLAFTVDSSEHLGTCLALFDSAIRASYALVTQPPTLFFKNHMHIAWKLTILVYILENIPPPETAQNNTSRKTLKQHSFIGIALSRSSNQRAEPYVLGFFQHNIVSSLRHSTRSYILETFSDGSGKEAQHTFCLSKVWGLEEGMFTKSNTNKKQRTSCAFLREPFISCNSS